MKTSIELELEDWQLINRALFKYIEIQQKAKERLENRESSNRTSKKLEGHTQEETDAMRIKVLIAETTARNESENQNK